MSPFLKEFSAEMGYEILVEPEFGYAGRIVTKEGKILYYHSTKFDINPLGASAIANDKSYSSFFLNQLGYPVPEGKAFYSDYWANVIKSGDNIEAAIKYAKKLGFPVIIKPNSESQGRGVEKINTPDELRKAFLAIVNNFNERVVIVQKIAKGQDYRIIVLEDEVICAYMRIPLVVVGVGKNTIAQLLRARQSDFVARGRDTVINLDDPRIAHSLSHLNMTLSTVLESGKNVQLLINANLSSGGEAKNVTDLLHPDFKKMAIKLTHDMGLRFCGIDIMTPNPIDKPLSEYVIIEINAAPGLDYYAESGEKQKEIVKNLYKKLIKYLII